MRNGSPSQRRSCGQTKSPTRSVRPTGGRVEGGSPVGDSPFCVSGFSSATVPIWGSSAPQVTTGARGGYSEVRGCRTSAFQRPMGHSARARVTFSGMKHPHFEHCFVARKYSHPWQMARRSRRATLLARSSDGRNRSVNRTGSFSFSTATEYRTGDAKEGRPLRADPLVVRSLVVGSEIPAVSNCLPDGGPSLRVKPETLLKIPSHLVVLLRVIEQALNVVVVVHGTFLSLARAIP